MKNVSYITDKKLSNKRFYKNELAILNSYLKNPHANATELSKLAHISRQTIYCHHGAVSNIPKNYEKHLKSEFNKVYNLVAKRNDSLEKFYFEILLFILHNKIFFEVVVLENKSRAFYFMSQKLKPNFTRFANLPCNSERIFRLYQAAVAEIILEWFENGAKNQEIEVVLKDIMYLSRNARRQLIPLVHES